jgi:multidrug resistance efflux pump
MNLSIDREAAQVAPKRSPALRLVSLLKRITVLTVAVVLAALILTSVLPPLVADQSDRAIVNAPVTLLTAPISGDVKSLTPLAGERIAANDRIAEIVNSRVDRSTLIVLEGRLSDTSERLRATEAKIESDNRYIAAIGSEIEEQKTAVEARYLAQISDLQSQVGSATTSLQEKQQLVFRQNSMVARSISAPEMAQLAKEEFSGAQFQKQGTEAKLEEKRSELASARSNIFVGDDMQQLAALAQKKRDMELDSQKLTIEEAETSAVLKSQTKLVEAERNRLESLERSIVTSPAPGELLFVNASVDRHVTAGDTLARLVDCNASFVVGIFSYRQGANFAPGARVTIHRAGQEAMSGSVTAVLPKTSDKVDEDYALPFPQTERRELYVLVKPDRPLLRATLAGSSPENGARCDIGNWVTIGRDGGWIPSTSILWKRVKANVEAAAQGGWSGSRATPAYVTSSPKPGGAIAEARGSGVGADRADDVLAQNQARLFSQMTNRREASQ